MRRLTLAGKLVAGLVAGSVAAALLAGCGQGELNQQAKYKPYRPAKLFADGAANQMPPAGTVARGDLAAAAALATRPAMTLVLLRRGQERYNIFCAPCHAATGDGDGAVVQRGFPQPHSLHDARLVAADDRTFLDTIANGYGAMYAFGDRISPADRWAIVAYIRALQFSQNASLADLPPDVRAAAAERVR